MSSNPEGPVGQLIVQAFEVSQSEHQTIMAQCIKASFRAGSKIPDSRMSVAIQRLGRLDVLCRSLEDELLHSPSAEGQLDFRHQYLLMFSDLWIGSAYAITYAFSDRDLYKGDQEFEAIAEDLRLIRVQVEKHQIASDWKLDQPLDFVTAPNQSGTIRTFRYDKNNRLRAHIGRVGQSEKQSVVWEVIVVNGDTTRWLERRSLSDRLLTGIDKVTQG
jgi:hypothetical protein